MNSRVVRSLNRALVLDLVRERGPISRASLARVSSLNKSTVSSIVNGLLEEDLLAEELVENTLVGRKPLNLHLKTGTHLVGALSFDSKVTRLAVVDLDGTIRHTLDVPTNGSPVREFVSACVSHLETARKQHRFPKLQCIGVTVAGVVDASQSKVEYAPFLGWKDLDLGALLRELCPEVDIVTVENDAKASAVAELFFGRHASRLGSFVFLSVSEGVGAGIVIDSVVLKGQAHLAGEFGHLTLVQGGEQCECGNRGCWQMYASERATVSRYARARQLSLQAAEKITMRQIIHAATVGEIAARDELLRMGDYLGLGISNIIKAVDPDTIVIGGQITGVWDLMYPAIVAGVRKGGFYGKLDHATIQPTSLGEQPSVLGAAAISYRKLFATINS
jgi:predicted NBD/HSP70 family sugar kinase